MSLAQHAAELRALVRDGRRIRLGDRNFERPHADLDALLSGMARLADRMEAEIPPRVLVADNDALGRVASAVVTGRGGVLHVIARKR